jgi:dTDP-4-dehydrorhamnose 3,5-epimerase
VARLADIGIGCGFVQDNQSSSRRAGTLRGLHFQRPPAAQAKLVGVLRGRVLDVAVDIRRGSPTYGQHVSTELTAASGQQVYIPAGFAHGFLTLEEDVLVMYKVSDHYAPAYDGGIRWNDPDIAFSWPFADVITSDKDGRLPYLKDFDSPFAYDGHPLAPMTVTELG